MFSAQFKPTACALALAVAAAGCASNEEISPVQQSLTQSLTRAETSVSEAEDAGAYEHGSVQLNMAREKLSEARLAAQEGDAERADRLAEEAALDAELADAMASNQETQSALQELNSTIQTLRDEISRSANPRNRPTAQ